MLGFGSSKFSEGTFGKGVMVGHGSIASTSIAQTFGIAQWPGHASTSSTSTVLTSGGILLGGTGYMQGTGTMYSYPVSTWVGFGDIETGQGTILTFGYLAWDKQDLSDATWTTQTVS